MFVNRDFYDFKIRGAVPDISFLVSTQGQGLLFFHKRKCTKIFESNQVFGLTKRGDCWYALLDLKLHGFIVKFQLQNTIGRNFAYAVRSLPKGTHQIDFFGDELFVTGTHRNYILAYNYSSFSQDPVLPGDHSKKAFPARMLASKRHRYKQSNYSHFNSLFVNPSSGDVMVLAHNLGSRTGRESEIYYMDKDSLAVTDIRPISGKNCHNLYDNGERLMVCNSLMGELCDYRGGKKVLFSCDKFTRGLAATDDYLLLGGSPHSTDDRSARISDSQVYFLNNKTFDAVGQIQIEGCQINDIRVVSHTDHAMIGK